MIVINFFAGPGAGKSTAAAGLFHIMKTQGHKVELVTEFAKDLVWAGNMGDLNNQLWVLANQEYRLSRLRGKVDYAITDSPLLLSSLYARGCFNTRWFHTTVLKMFDRYENLNFFVRRVKPYQPEGRKHNFDEAVELDNRVNALLKDLGIPYIEIDGDADAALRTYEEVMKDWPRWEVA